jgi:hypothetical protein
LFPAVSLKLSALVTTVLPVLLPVLPILTNTASNTQNHYDNNNKIFGIAFSSTYLAPSGQPILHCINDGGNGERLVIWD